jgi:hypothetical protein
VNLSLFSKKLAKAGIVFLSLSLAPRAWARNAKAHLIPLSPEQEIPGFHLKSDDVEIRSDGTRVQGIIRGKFDRESWNLIQGEQHLIQPSRTSSDFTAKVPLSGPKTDVEFSAIGPHGEVEKFRAQVQVENWDQVQSRAVWTSSLGWTQLSIQQTRIPDFSETALSAKIGYQAPLRWKNWNWATNTFFTAAPFSSNIPGVHARAFGVNLRAGYRPPWIGGPWKLTLWMGGYYTTLFVTNGALGYQNELGPQLYPTLVRSFGSRDELGAYIKYSPVAGEGSLYRFYNREVAFGFGWSHGLKNGHPMSLSLDIAQVHLEFPATQSTVICESVTTSLGYAF